MVAPVQDVLDEMVTVAQAAAMLKVHRSTVTRWVQRGRIEADAKVPDRMGTLLFRRARIEALLPPG